MYTMNGPTLRYTLVYTLFPRKVHTLSTDGYYRPMGYGRGHLVRSECMGGVMYHKVEELMPFKCDCRLNQREIQMSDTSKVKQPASIWEVQRLRTLLLAHNPSRWGEIHDGDHFTHLGEAINNAEDILQEMRETLLELQKIAPDNK